MQAQAQQGDLAVGDPPDMIEIKGYLVNDTQVSLTIRGILIRLSRDADVAKAREMIHQNPHASMNAAARFEVLLASAEEWLNNNMFALSAFDRAAIWHGLVDYRRRVHMPQPSPYQQDIVTEYYVPWHAPKYTSDDSAWPTESLVRSLKLHENIGFLFKSTKRLLDLLTPLSVHVLPYIMDGKNVMICSSSEFEKTLTLAISAIDFVARYRDFRPRPLHAAPRVLIVVATNRSFFQLYDYLQMLINNKMRMGIVIGGMEDELFPPLDNLPRGIDIMLATAHRLKEADRIGLIDWSRLRLVALHELNLFSRDSKAIAETLLDPLRGPIGTAADERYQLIATHERVYNTGPFLAKMKSMMKGSQMYHISVGCPAYDVPDIGYYFHEVENETVVHRVREAQGIIQRCGGLSAVILWSISGRAGDAHSIFKNSARSGNCFLIRSRTDAKAVFLKRHFLMEKFGCVVLNTTANHAAELDLEPDFLVIHADLPVAAFSLYPTKYRWFDASISVGRTDSGNCRCYTFLNPDDVRDCIMAKEIIEVLQSYRKDIPKELSKIADGPGDDEAASATVAFPPRKRTASDAGI